MKTPSFILQFVCVLYITAFLPNALIQGHGFCKHAIIKQSHASKNGDIVSICLRAVRGKKICIPSYDIDTPLPEEEKNAHNSGCGGVSIEQQKQTLILHQSVDDATDTVKEQLPELEKFGNQSTKLDQYITNITFEEGITIVQENTLPNNVSTKEKDENQITIFEYDDGNIVVRTASKGIPGQDIVGLPTIQIQPSDRKKQQTKIRLAGNR